MTRGDQPRWPRGTPVGPGGKGPGGGRYRDAVSIPGSGMPGGDGPTSRAGRWAQRISDAVGGRRRRDRGDSGDPEQDFYAMLREAREQHGEPEDEDEVRRVTEAWIDEGGAGQGLELSTAPSASELETIGHLSNMAGPGGWVDVAAFRGLFRPDDLQRLERKGWVERSGDRYRIDPRGMEGRSGPTESGALVGDIYPADPLVRRVNTGGPETIEGDWADRVDRAIGGGVPPSSAQGYVAGDDDDYQERLLAWEQRVSEYLRDVEGLDEERLGRFWERVALDGGAGPDDDGGDPERWAADTLVDQEDDDGYDDEDWGDDGDEPPVRSRDDYNDRILDEAASVEYENTHPDDLDDEAESDEELVAQMEIVRQARDRARQTGSVEDKAAWDRAVDHLRGMLLISYLDPEDLPRLWDRTVEED